MIRCPKCGTMNRDSNRLCKECNARLPQTSILCPECGMANPVGNVLCDRCNTRLITATEGLPRTVKADEDAVAGVKGISLPTLPSASAGMPEPTELPDWLAELAQETFADATAPSANQDADWLSALLSDPQTSAQNAEAESLAPAELPDWFSDLVEAEPAATPVIDADAGLIADELVAAELPDWFSGFVEAPTAAVSLVEEVPDVVPAPADELPNWFSGLAENEPDGESLESSSTEVLPDWFDGFVEPAASQKTQEEEPASTEALDWLADLPAVSPERAEDRQSAADLPDWLRGADDVSPGSYGQVRSLPSWLTPDSESNVPDDEEAAQELPAWLTSAGARSLPETLAAVGPVPDRPPAKAEFDTLAEQPSESFPEEEELPDWLADILLEEPESTEAQPETPVEQEELPDWLSGLALSETEFAAEPVKPEPGPVKAPDWLSNVFTEEPARLAAQPDKPRVEPEMPSWLSGILSESPTSPEVQPLGQEEGEAALPDWLSGGADEDPVFEETPAAEGALAAAELPDWLVSLTEEDVETEAGAETLEDRADSPSVSTVPDWLQDLPETPDIIALTPAAPAFIPDKGLAGDETKDDAFLFDDDLTPLPATRTTATSEDAPVPEWLKDLGPATEEGIPFGESYVEEDENLARAEVPGWLQDLRPPGTGPLPPLPEARAVDGEPRSEIEGLARAEIPDWVQKLRPEPTAEGEVAVSRDFLPAVLEDEGPLAGLLGVLPATMVVDMPLDFAGASRPEIPEAVVAQAQLWQRLLEQPRSVERPVAQQRVRSGAGEPVSRLLVTVLLIAVTVFGLLAGEPQFSQALSNPHIEAWGTAIDALAPGDVVIVAVEYGPAEAGEMSTIAEALLEHLAEKQVQVIAVSTLPEGVGLAYGLLDKVGLSNALPAERSSFLSGAANGVAMFLSEGEADGELLIVLSARAERLRWWIELNNVSRSVDGVSIDPLPIGVGASASVAPMAAPYLASSNVKGWLAGFPDVVAYREFRGVTDSYFNRRLDALLLSHWVALALLIFGLCYYLAAGKKGNA